jgi:hypothetical protein
MPTQKTCALCRYAIRDEDPIVVEQADVFHTPCWLRIESKTLVANLGGSDPICPVCQRAIRPEEYVVGRRVHLTHETCAHGPTLSEAER